MLDTIELETTLRSCNMLNKCMQNTINARAQLHRKGVQLIHLRESIMNVNRMVDVSQLLTICENRTEGYRSLSTQMVYGNGRSFVWYHGERDTLG